MILAAACRYSSLMGRPACNRPASNTTPIVPSGTARGQLVRRPAASADNKPAPPAGRASLFSSHLATDADLDAAGVACLDDLPQGPQDCRMRGIVEVGDAAVATVDGQQVLDQVIGADAEEIAFFRQQFAGEGGAGDLDHRADA